MKVVMLFVFLILSKAIYAETSSLSEEENRIIARGPIDNTQYIASGVLGTIPGFGIGHALQGRWKEKGWIFTAGETVGMGLMMAAGASCMGGSMMNDNNDDHNCSGGNMALMIPGMLTFLGFKVWEIVDVWTYPPAHNKRLKEIESRTENVEASLSLAPFIYQSSSGLALHVNF